MAISILYVINFLFAIVTDSYFVFDCVTRANSVWPFLRGRQRRNGELCDSRFGQHGCYQNCWHTLLTQSDKGAGCFNRVDHPVDRAY